MNMIFSGDDYNPFEDIDVITDEAVPENHMYMVHNASNSTNGTIWVSPNTSGGSSGGINTNPYININPPYQVTQTTSTINITVAEPTYNILELPRKKMPEKVFVDGLLKTCGLLGTDAECAYAGNNKLIFSPGTVSEADNSIFSSGNKPSRLPTISIEYSDAIYHYVVDSVPMKGDSTTILDVRQVGMIKKEK